MRLATLRLPTGTSAARIEGDHGVLLDAEDVGELLRGDWSESARADGPRVELRPEMYAPLVPRPEKVICVGLNYRAHIEEMGRELPEHPTLFAKFAGSLVGAHDDIVLPAWAGDVDWEAELAVVVGRSVRHAALDEAAAAIAGYSVFNDITSRQWQDRTSQFLQGKTFDTSTPFGPWLVTADEPGAEPGPAQRITCEVDGEVVQDAVTGDLLFTGAELVAYVSQVCRLNPGDVIATGTPGGVGHGRRPRRYLTADAEVVTSISGLGSMRNRYVVEAGTDAKTC